MEFQSVVRRRRMVRTYIDRPIPSKVVERILRTGHRGPSAGFSQGYAFLVFDGPEQVASFWAGLEDDGGRPDWVEGLRNAPLIVVPVAAKDVYLDRYAEPDKGWTDRAEERWPVPYWHVDTAFAAMLILLTAVDEGLGALFFGLSSDRNAIGRFCRAFGVPEGHEPIGAIAIGHPGRDRVASSARRGRRPMDEIVHRGHW